MSSIELTIADIESQLTDHGQFTLLDWMLAKNRVAYGAYEAWRNGEAANLEVVAQWDREWLQGAIQQVDTLCQQLKLASEVMEYGSWQGAQKNLVFSRDGLLQHALSQVWRRPEDLPQLDLFMDNAAVVGENAVKHALAARQWSDATHHLASLTETNPSHAKLGTYQDLINYGLHMQRSPEVSGEALPAELDGLLTEVAPLAKETLKAQSRDYLAPAWQRLATGAKGTFENWQCHPGFMLAQIPDWASSQAALEADQHLYDQPEWLCLLANAYFYTQQPSLGFWIWGQMAERYPDFVEGNIGSHPLAKKHTTLIELWDNFLAYDEHWPSSWFLGFMLIDRPGLVHTLDQLPQSSGEAVKSGVNQTVLQLVQAKLAEADQTLLRAQLKLQAPQLLNRFMNKRDWYARNRE